MYYILTDKNDMVSYEYLSILKGKCIKVKYKCTTGLNIAKKNEGYHVLNSNSPSGRWYTPDPSNCYYLRYANISVQSDITDSDIIEKGSNRIILSDRYYLYDPKTIKKFNIKVDQYMIFGACYYGDIKFLEWWKNFRLSSAFLNGHMHTLNSFGLKWLSNSGLDIVYDHGVLKYAFRYIHIHDVHINAIKWLKHNNFMVKLSRKHKVYYYGKNCYDTIKKKLMI
jgi:hypothetical protein